MTFLRTNFTSYGSTIGWFIGLLGSNYYIVLVIYGVRVSIKIVGYGDEGEVCCGGMCGVRELSSFGC